MTEEFDTRCYPTPVGGELAAALVPLALWGLRHEFDEPRRPGQSYRAEWTLVFLATLIDPAATSGIRAMVQFHLDDSAATLSIDDGKVHVVPGEVDLADVVVTTDLRTLAALTAGPATPDLAEFSERIRIEGDPALGQRLFELLSRNGFGGLLR